MHTLNSVTGRFLLALILLLAWCRPASAEFKAGIAVRDVTPNPLLPVSGGVGPSHPVTERKGSLTVRALVIESGATRVAIVSADFLGFPSVLADKARALVPGIPPENILVGATHTHSAPDCYGFPDGRGGTSADLDYLDTVCRRMAEAINEAAANLQPAAIRVATGEARGKIAYNYYAEALFDPRCSVIQFADGQDRPFATLVNYAVHPEVLGASNGILSPDLVGPLYDRIAERGGGTGIFMNGALGGMVTADCRGPDGKDLRTWDECLRIGHLLAEEALRIVSRAPRQAEPRLRSFWKDIELPIDSPLLLAVLNASPLPYKDRVRENRIPTRLNLIELGNARILTIPGEALPNIGTYLKRKMGAEHPFLFGLTNDALGYILTKEDWGSFKRYEYISRTSLGERTGEIFVAEALDLLRRAADEPNR